MPPGRDHPGYGCGMGIYLVVEIIIYFLGHLFIRVFLFAQWGSVGTQHCTECEMLSWTSRSRFLENLIFTSLLYCIYSGIPYRILFRLG